MKMADALAGHGHEHYSARHVAPTTTESNGSLWGQVVSVPLTNTTNGPSWERTLNQNRAVEEARKYSQETDGNSICKVVLIL